MRRSIVVLVLCAFVALLNGCALPQYAEDHIIERKGSVTVRASRYAGREEDPVHELWINLAKSPDFQFRFPDGKWVNAREITLRVLIERGMRIDKYSNFSSASWHPDMSIFSSVVGRHQYFSFRIEDDEAVSSLTLGACGSSFREVLRTMDGSTFGFPMKIKEVEQLFGPVSSVRRIAIVTGFSCF